MVEQYDRATVLWIGAETLRTLADLATFYDPDGQLKPIDVVRRHRAELLAIAAQIRGQADGAELAGVVDSLAHLMREIPADTTPPGGDAESGDAGSATPHNPTAPAAAAESSDWRSREV